MAEPAYLEDLIHAGNVVCAIDLRGLGSASPRFPRQGPDFYRNHDLDQDYAWAGFVLGLPVLGQRVTDILACLDYLAKRPDVDTGRLRILGEGRAALAALMAAVVEDRPRSVLLDRCLASYTSIIESAMYTVPLSSPHLMHEAVCGGSGGRRAVTGQRPWASVVTERSQDAFVGSSLANGATMMPFALRTRDVPRVVGTTAPLWWRQESSQGDRHARST